MHVSAHSTPPACQLATNVSLVPCSIVLVRHTHKVDGVDYLTLIQSIALSSNSERLYLMHKLLNQQTPAISPFQGEYGYIH